MEAPQHDISSPSPQVKAMFHLGSETYNIHANMGILSEQLVSMKAESMSVLKDFIIKHNVTNDVPDELDEVSEDDDDDDDDDDEIAKKPKPKKQK